MTRKRIAVENDELRVVVMLFGPKVEHGPRLARRVSNEAVAMTIRTSYPTRLKLRIGIIVAQQAMEKTTENGLVLANEALCDQKIMAYVHDFCFKTCVEKVPLFLNFLTSDFLFFRNTLEKRTHLAAKKVYLN